jgi:flagellar capping protein FliD
VDGQDIQGTINGEPATGAPNGMLTGNSSNPKTDGLQIQYTGNALGKVGTVTIGKGMAAMVNQLMAQFTDPVNGLLTAKDKSMSDQYTDISDQITKLQTRLAEKQAELTAKFAAMEQTISKLHSQSSQLAQLGNN